MTKILEPIFKADEEDDPFAEYANWGEQDTRKPGQNAEQDKTEQAPVSSELIGKKPSSRQFSVDDIRKLKDLAAKQASNIAVARNHYSDPKKNPRLYREANLHSAHNESFADMHDAWNKVSNSDEYKSLPLHEKWKAQRKFINDWHSQNPEHYHSVIENIHNAHQKGEQADTAHTQEEKRRLEHAAMGGGLGEMSGKEAAAHFGVKAGGEDDIPQVATTGSSAVSFGSANPEAIKQALSSKRFESVPEETVDVDPLSGSAPIKKHPDFDKPENKALVNDFASRYAGLMNSKFVDKLKRDMGASSQIDEAAVNDAAHNAMWHALHNYDAQRSDMSLHNFIKFRVIDAMKNNIKQQHTEQVTAAAKRAAKVNPSEKKFSPTVKVYTPEEKAALQAKMTGSQQSAQVAKPEQPVPSPVEAPKPEAAVSATAPEVPKAEAVSQPQTELAKPAEAPKSKPHFSTQLNDAARKRLDHINSIKTIRRPGGGS